MKKRTAALFACVLILIMTLTGCRTSYRVGGKALSAIDLSQSKAEEVLASNLMIMLNSDSAEYVNSLSASADITFDDEWTQWKEYIANLGEYNDFQVGSAWNYGGDTVICLTAALGDNHVAIDSKWNARDKLTELWIYRAAQEEEAEQALPKGVIEYDITLGEGTDYPLPGKITMPEAQMGSETGMPAVVLVHGSGGNNMDHAAGNTHAFRDLAWHLAEQGIITIRYDKRTFVYSEQWVDDTSDIKRTIDWETVEDAATAGKLLAETKGVDPSRIYLLGHSLGGLVIPRIDEAAGGLFAGYILMAVPSRPWQEAVYDQYINYGLANLDDDDVYYTANYLESQLKTIDSDLDDYTEAQLDNEILLNMPAGYWKDLNRMDYIEAFEDTSKPMLILQGGADYQILADKDFAGWQDLLEDEDTVTLRLYEGLNHLFMRSQGCFMGCSKEYDMPNHVESKVISDLSAWING